MGGGKGVGQRGERVCVREKEEEERLMSVVGEEMCIRDFFFQAEGGIRVFCLSRRLEDVCKGQIL